jgi:hypothetical protein
MTDILLNRCARLASEAVRRLNDGTLDHPHKDQRPYWPAFRVPDRIAVLPVGKPEFASGGIGRNDNWCFERTVEVYGRIKYDTVLLATVQLSGCTFKHADQTITDDDETWRVDSIKYLGLEPDGEGRWKQVNKHCSNLNGTPLIEGLGI